MIFQKLKTIYAHLTIFYAKTAERESVQRNYFSLRKLTSFLASSAKCTANCLARGNHSFGSIETDIFIVSKNSQQRYYISVWSLPPLVIFSLVRPTVKNKF